MRQRYRPAEKQAMADIKHGTAVIGRNPFRGIGSETGSPDSVTVRVAERIKAEDRQPGSGAHVEAENQLVLVKDSAGLKLVLRYRSRGEHAGEELMDAMRVNIGARKRGNLRELAFNGAGELDRIRRAQRGINGVCGGLRSRQRRNIWV